MGMLATAGTQRGLGVEPVTITLAVLAVVNLFSKLLNFGYNPQKLNDTAITEAVKQAMNVLWYNLTGEALNGVHQTATPGQYGAEHIALFSESRYPDVPYPAGRPDIDPAEIIAATEQVIAQGRANLVRSESFAGYDFNAQYMVNLMNQVAQRRAQEQPFGELLSFGDSSNWAAMLPWLLGGWLAYKVVL